MRIATRSAATARCAAASRRGRIGVGDRPLAVVADIWTSASTCSGACAGHACCWQPMCRSLRCQRRCLRCRAPDAARERPISRWQAAAKRTSSAGVLPSWNKPGAAPGHRVESSPLAILARRHAFPAPEGMDEVGHLAVAEALGDFLQANRAGGQQLFGEGLAHLVEQQAVAAALVVQAATQGTHGEVQFHGQGLHVRQVAGRPQQAVADASGQTAAHLAAGEQGAALLLAGARHLWIGAGQRSRKRRSKTTRLSAWPNAGHRPSSRTGRGIGGRWAAEAGAEDRQALPGEVALDAQHATGVAFEEENPQVLGNAGVVEHQVRFIVVYLQADAMEGEGQVEVAQAQLRGAEEGRAAEQGEAPDAVGVEVIAQACRQARRAGVASAGPGCALRSVPGPRRFPRRDRRAGGYPGRYLPGTAPGRGRGRCRTGSAGAR